MSSGTRRLRLVDAPVRGDSGLPTFKPLSVRGRSVAIGETRPDSGAHAFAIELAEACAALQHPALVVLCERASDAGFASPHVGRLSALASHVLRQSIESEADLEALLARAACEAPHAPWLFLGEPPVIALSGALRVVIDRSGGSAVSARARAMKAASHLILSAPRAGVARQLAAGFLVPTSAP